MTDLEKAARQALAVLESDNLWPVPHAANAAIDALRAALAQQQVRLEWVGLTNKEIYDCWPKNNEPVAIARAIEAAFKKKNAQQAEPVVEPKGGK
jgi:hypothetical protein